MCGRTACTLAADDIQKSCRYLNPKSNNYETPKWKDGSTGGRCYQPSHNIAPTDITPVLVSGTHFPDEEARLLKPMMWGIVPPWHKGSYKSHGLSTNNCRLENMKKSKLYQKPFSKGQRCVVLCDGFYEWQTTKAKGSKQPYFIHAPQIEGVKIEDPETWNLNPTDEDWKGPKLLKMAALFDFWRSPEGEEIISYSVVTLESNKTLSWLHHRMPAVLETEAALTLWLDQGQLSNVENVTELVWHPVSALVNNARNKDPKCMLPVNLEEEAKKKFQSKSAGFMQAWLKKSNKSKELREDNNSETEEECDRKKRKID